MCRLQYTLYVAYVSKHAYFHALDVPEFTVEKVSEAPAGGYRLYSALLGNNGHLSDVYIFPL